MQIICIKNSWTIIAYKGILLLLLLLLLFLVPWNHIITWKLLMFDRNTWNHINVRKKTDFGTKQPKKGWNDIQPNQPKLSFPNPAMCKIIG